ncbi:MAG: hypothetical protein ACI9FR_000140 [Cryomorphaceae bacterium]|jgi:hypothetical protein
MTSILLPVVVLMLITMLVWLNMFIKRVVALNALNVDPQSIVTPEKLNAALDDKVNAPANCFKNMFEIPVIFYALCIIIAMTGSVDELYSDLAWGFVGLRSVQAGIHCTYNRVMHRFYSYIASSVLLWIMLVRFFLALV